MHHPAHAGKTPQVLDDLIHRVTGVNDHRQIVTAGQSQLSGEILGLRAGIKVGQVVI